MEVIQIPVLNDNYVYLIHDPVSEETAVVDPALAAPVLETADKRGWRITHILNTHHHYDHVDGNLEIKQKTGATIYGAAHDAARIPGIDVYVSEGDVVSIGQNQATVIKVTGHTTGHIAYHFADQNALFCGDTLFALGCGRLFEGTPQEMWESLSKIKALPKETKIYCAHEYTLANLEFALSIDPKNPDLQLRGEQIRKLRDQNKPTIPSLLGDELSTNPFLRGDDMALAASLGMEGQSADRVFAEIRARKDNF
ncbi:MAG: hydroxyacylglutathione hydrolase [Alphaproteobacteria bacterium]|nr:hydroxyacylglutathione hydrolase [Alphaproteobacteria bacterium]